MRRKIILLLVGVILLTSFTSIAISQFFRQDTPPLIEAQASDTFGTLPLDVSFSCIYSDLEGDVTKILWDFGDGSISEQKTTTHTYTNMGTYHATVSIWDETGQKTTDSIVITVVLEYDPTAIITANTTCGTPPFQVLFTGEAYHIESPVSSYMWDFDDDAISEKQQTVHTFDKTGVYDVSLTVLFENGDEAHSSLDITVIDSYIPQAIASASRTESPVFAEVEFFGTCIDSDSSNHSYQWNFGDRLLKKNMISSEQNPTHRFYKPGIYFVTLNVTDESGNSDWDTIIIEITDTYWYQTVSRLGENMVTKLIESNFPIISRILNIFH